MSLLCVLGALQKLLELRRCRHESVGDVRYSFWPAAGPSSEGQKLLKRISYGLGFRGLGFRGLGFRV